MGGSLQELTRLNGRAPNSETILESLRRDHAVVLENILDLSQVDAILAELEPFIAGTEPIDDEFVGRSTTRTGGLVARSKTARQAVAHTTVLDAANRFLTNHSKNIQLNLTQIMRILPGEKAQALHRDRYLWSRSLPREVEPMFNCMWALTDFTEENGATRVVPGSQAWDWERPLASESSIAAEMPAGSVLFYTGSVVHGGGANRSTDPRIGMSITYLLSWLRQEENQYLSCPPEVARQLEPTLQELLGYSIGNGSLGYFSPTTPSQGHPDTLPPEFALGRREMGAFQKQEPF
jgi:ectoine hydroxylase-related dioxygenase (phytanoyl-CoA dioxygenase family)